MTCGLRNSSKIPPAISRTPSRPFSTRPTLKVVSSAGDSGLAAPRAGARRLPLGIPPARFGLFLAAGGRNPPLGALRGGGKRRPRGGRAGRAAGAGHPPGGPPPRFVFSAPLREPRLERFPLGHR